MNELVSITLRELLQRKRICQQVFSKHHAKDDRLTIISQALSTSDHSFEAYSIRPTSRILGRGCEMEPILIEGKVGLYWEQNIGEIVKDSQSHYRRHEVTRSY